MERFLSIHALHEEGFSKKAIARRLDVAVRTVRRVLRATGAGATEQLCIPAPDDSARQRLPQRESRS